MELAGTAATAVPLAVTEAPTEVDMEVRIYPSSTLSLTHSRVCLSINVSGDRGGGKTVIIALSHSLTQT